MKIKSLMFSFFFIILISLVGYALKINHSKGNLNLIKINNEQTENDLKVSDYFLNKNNTFKDRYDHLFNYFLDSFIKHSTHDNALANYPGMLSDAGNFINRIEGTARTLPLLSAWLYSGRNPNIVIGNKTLYLPSIIKNSILSGTNPLSENYWGDIKDYDQRILEASDIAKSLWLTKNIIWISFTDEEKLQITKWLKQGGNAKTIKNNWLLSPVIIQSFLYNVGLLDKVDYSNYDTFMRNYLEKGWFKDGENGEVDYYNAWGIGYDLFWILMISNHDRNKISNIINESSDLTAHLISKNGIPFMGRSMCYRTAIPSPMIMNGIIKDTPYTQSVAKTGLDYTWKYFIEKKSLVSETLSMGYFGNNEIFVNSYSGSGSCLWGLRSLILAFMNKSNSYFWDGGFGELPIDTGDYIIDAPALGWEITGDSKSGEIKITIDKNHGNAPLIIKGNYFKRIINIALGKSGRSDQYDIEYLKYQYSSLHPISETGK